MLPGGVPDVTAVREWIDVPASEISDDQLLQVIEAELAIQLTYCNWYGEIIYPPPLAQALLRRCARQVASRGVPLGTPIIGSEYGTGPIPSYDGEIERLEGPYRVWVFA